MVKREKGKGRAAEGSREKGQGGWAPIGNAGRCATCQVDDVECVINVDAITKWREEAERG